MTVNTLPPAQQMLLQQAFTLHGQGRLDAACALYRQILADQPDNAEVLCWLGTAECQMEQYDAAIADLTRSLALEPGQPIALYNRGNAFSCRNRPDKALADYEQATALQPDYVEAWYNQGFVLQGQRRWKDALVRYDRALVVRPDMALAHNNRGGVLLELGRFDEAMASYDRAVALVPTYADAIAGRGSVQRELGQVDEALASYEQALALAPDHSEVLNNRGALLQKLGRLEEAAASFDKVLAVDPGLADAHHNRGAVMHRLKRFDQAVASYDRALTADPSLDWVAGHAQHARMQMCDWRDFDRRRDDLVARLRRGERAMVPFVAQTLSDSPELHRQAADIFAAEFPGAAVALPPYGGHDRLRIGYFSRDIADHPVAHLLAGLFEAHDRSRFEVSVFSYGPDRPDAWRRRIFNAVEHVYDLPDAGDADIIALARQNEIDVAIDLTGYTEGARPSLFAARVAPVQVEYLGYLGTLGRSGGGAFIDYLLADEVIVPAEARAFYAEAVAYLPSYQVNDDKTAAAERTFRRADLGLPETGFVFGSFNQPYKITPEVFDGWMRILGQVPDSVLWLYGGNDAAVANLQAEAQRRGISPARLVFAAGLPLAEHLARLAAADLLLDTHPYNAGATASNALRIGLPVLTRIGQSFAGRMGASLLTAAGVPELITETPEAYEALAVRLATQPEALAAVKAKLKANLPDCRLFDTAGATRALEAAYMAMHQRALTGQPPVSLTI